MRTLIAIVAGFALWSVLWVGGHQLAVTNLPRLYDAQGAPLDPRTLAAYLFFSLVCSCAAGWLAAKLASRESRAVFWLGVVLLLTGIGVQSSVWNSEPLWYHLSFLALLVPVTLFGGHRARAKAG